MTRHNMQRQFPSEVWTNYGKTGIPWDWQGVFTHHQVRQDKFDCGAAFPWTTLKRTLGLQEVNL